MNLVQMMGIWLVVEMELKLVAEIKSGLLLVSVRELVWCWVAILGERMVHEMEIILFAAMDMQLVPEIVMSLVFLMEMQLFVVMEMDLVPQIE